MGRSGVSWAVWAGLGVGMKHRQARAARNSVRRALPPQRRRLARRSLEGGSGTPPANCNAPCGKTRMKQSCDDRNDMSKLDLQYDL